MLGRIACGRGLLEATSHILLPSANSPHRFASEGCSPIRALAYACTHCRISDDVGHETHRYQIDRVESPLARHMHD